MREEISTLLDKWYDELNGLEDTMQGEKYEQLQKCIEDLEVVYQNLLKAQWKEHLRTQK